MKTKFIFFVVIYGFGMWFFQIHSMSNLESRKILSLKEIAIKYLAKNRNLLNGKEYKLTSELQQVFGYDYELYNAIFDRDIVKLVKLLKSGISPNLILLHDRRMLAPIHIVAIIGYIEILIFLIKFGSDINLQDSLGNTALHLAKYNGQDQIIEILLKSGARDLTNQAGLKWNEIRTIFKYQ